MKEPYQKDEAFLADIARTRGDRNRFRVWWLGQSGFLVQWCGEHLLFDPYLSDSLTRKYAATDKPHVRITARVVAPERLNFLNLVTSSHNHTDHLDAETLQPLLRENQGLKLLCPAANTAFVQERLAVGAASLQPINDGQTTTVGRFKITAVPSAHEELDRDEAGQFRYLGYVAEFGPWSIYHSGDTIRYPGMAERLGKWKLDLMLLPINGRNPARRVAGNLDGAEAAALAKDVGARLVIPCHYDMFQFNTADPATFVNAAAGIGQPCCILRCGESWTSHPAAFAGP